MLIASRVFRGVDIMIKCFSLAAALVALAGGPAWAGAPPALDDGLFAGDCMKILIVDDHALFRAGLRMLLAAIGRNICCIEAADVNEALALIARAAEGSVREPI